jgi:hypothetical protein
MTAIPPERPDTGEAAADGGWIREVVRTRRLLAGLFVLMIVGAISTFYQAVALYVCSRHPDDYCDRNFLTVGHILAPWGLFVVFGACLVASLVMLRRGRRAFYVPLWGALAMVVCSLLAYYLFVLAMR